VDVIPGSAAARAGLNTGDMLESIGGVGTRDMPLAYAEMLLAGDVGTNVEISVLRVRNPEPTKMTLTRALPRVPAVTSKVLPDGIGLINVPALETGKTKDIANVMDQLQKQGAKKFILDVRNCAIGKPEEGVALANLFVEKGTLTYLQGQKVARQNFDADPAKAAYKAQPIAVLTNRGTANGCELAAAGLQDNKRAEVIGERSYGDAAVRRAIVLDDGSAVILSVAKYYTAAGKAIQDVGVTPAIMVADFEPGSVDGDDDNPPTTPETPKKDEDAVLKRAIEVLTKGKSAEAAQAPAGNRPNLEVPDRPLTTKKPE
jgi:carboxyl-terminal processing protease